MAPLAAASPTAAPTLATTTTVQLYALHFAPTPTGKLLVGSWLLRTDALFATLAAPPRDIPLPVDVKAAVPPSPPGPPPLPTGNWPGPEAEAYRGETDESEKGFRTVRAEICILLLFRRWEIPDVVTSPLHTASCSLPGDAVVDAGSGSGSGGVVRCGEGTTATC